MSDVKEVYERVTAQAPPTTDALERQRYLQARRLRKRRVGAIAGVAAIGVLLVASAIAARSGPTAPLDAPTPSPTSTGVTGLSHLFLDLRTGQMTPLPVTLAWRGLYFNPSPDGTRFTFDPCCDPPNRGFVANVDGTGIRAVTPPDVDAFGMRWSPDGRRIVYQGRDASTDDIGNIFVLDLASGTTQRITDIPKDADNIWWFTAPTFTPDGAAITYTLPVETLDGTRWNTWTTPIGRGAPTLLLDNASFVRYSPVGTQMTYLHAPDHLGADELWVADADGGRARRLVAGHDIAWPTWSPDGSRIAFEMQDPAASDTWPISSVFVVDVDTGAVTKVAEGWDAAVLPIGGTAVPEWFDDHTLVVGPSSYPGEPSAVVTST
jgi:Tol biopolymer transport system component